MTKPVTVEEFLLAEEQAQQLLAEQRKADEDNSRLATQAKQEIAREQALEAFMNRDLRPSEAAVMLGVHVSTLKKMLKTGTLQGYRIGSRGDWRVTRAALQAFKIRGGAW